MKASTRKRNQRIDAKLAALCEEVPPGTVLSCKEISDAIGGDLTPQRISQIQDEALQKLRRLLRHLPEVKEGGYSLV